jgi:hypothetical protein
VRVLKSSIQGKASVTEEAPTPSTSAKEEK